MDSSIWEEEDHVFRVFMAMMSLKDSNHVVSMDGYKLARRIHRDLAEVEDALRILSEPDKRRPDQEHEGRRIKKVDDGWLILNGEYYRQLVAMEMRRTRNRRAQASYRERKRKGKVSRTQAERLEEKAAVNGNQEEQRRLAEMRDNVPPGSYSGEPEPGGLPGHEEEGPATPL